MGLGLHNATDAPRSSRTGVGHAGAAIFERSALGWPLFVVLVPMTDFTFFLTFVIHELLWFLKSPLNWV